MFQKNFGSEKVYGQEAGKVIIQTFRRNFFCLTVPKLFVEEPFCAVLQNFSGSEKVYGEEGGGGISKLSVEMFSSQSAEKIRKGIFYCFISFGYRKMLCFRGLCHDFPAKFFCLTVPKHFGG